MEWNDWSAVTTRRCWPATLPASSQPQLPGVDVKECDDRKFGGGAFALIAPAGTITNPTIVRRNTIRHIGPSAGIQIGKNSIAQLNHMCAPNRHSLARGSLSGQRLELTCGEQV